MPPSAASARTGSRPGRGQARRRSGGDHRELETPRRQSNKSPKSRDRAEADGIRIPTIWLKTLAVLPLALLSLIAAVTLLRLVRAEAEAASFWRVPQLRWFGLGAAVLLLCLLIPPMRTPLRALYVLGHELAHGVAVMVSGGRIDELVWGPNGGYLVANRTGTLITLAPYLLPLWAMVWTGVLSTTGLFVEIPHFQAILWYGLGAAGTFHLVFTLWMSSMEQSDFLPNGLAFSMLTIFLVNSLWLLGMLCWSEPGIDFARVGQVAWDSGELLLRLGRQLANPTA